MGTAQNKKINKTTAQDFNIYMPWKEYRTLEEVTPRFHRHLRATYFRERGQGVNLMLEYVRFFLIKENYESFPLGPLFLPKSTKMDIRWCTVLQALKFPWALWVVLNKLFDSGRDAGYERAAAYRKGVATTKFRMAVLAGLEAAFADGLDEAPYEGGYFVLMGKPVWVNGPPDEA